MKITFKEDGSTFMVLFDDIIHIFVRKEYFSSFIAFYSERLYHIEFYSKDNSVMHISYEDEYIWKEVLTLLNDKLYYSS